MDYEVLSSMLPLGRPGKMVLGLETTRDLMDVLGNPQDKVPTIHVAGTNGKGSTAMYMATVLKEAGYKVGLYTSPSLHEFNDRIQINGVSITDDQIYDFAKEIREYVLDTDLYFTEFELYTALAWLHFARESVDVCIIETGIGGRLDATNIIQSPILSVITKISYDHQDVLGDTLPEIAGEKAGIIKEGSPVVYYPQEDEVDDVIINKAKEMGSTYATADLNALDYTLTDGRTQDFTYKNEEYTISLMETHQIYNAIVAIEAINVINAGEEFHIPQNALHDGLLQARWPGRFEWVSENPDIIIDGSHNLDGLTNLGDNIERYFSDRPRIAVVGMLGDKHHNEALPGTIQKFDAAVTVQPDSERALTSDEMAEWIKKNNLLPANKVYSEGKNYAQALTKAIELTEKFGNDAMICVFGSFYYIGDMREIIKKKFQ